METYRKNLILNLKKEKRLLTDALPSTDDADTDNLANLHTYITDTLDISIEFLETASADDMKAVLPTLQSQHADIDLPSYFVDICRYSSDKKCDDIARVHEEVTYYLDAIKDKLSGGKRASKRRRHSRRARSKRRR